MYSNRARTPVEAQTPREQCNLIQNEISGVNVGNSNKNKLSSGCMSFKRCQSTFGLLVRGVGFLTMITSIVEILT